MDSPQSSAPGSSPDITLPPSFLSVKQVQDLPSAALRTGSLVNVIGFVKDIQPPYKTAGTDFKCTFEILDSSVRYETTGIKVHIFWPQSYMPVLGAGDVVLVRNAKAQMYYGFPSLLKNIATEIHVLPSSQIPASPSDTSKAPWRPYPPKKAVKNPTAAETNYVIGAKERVADLPLISVTEFQQRAEQAMNLKDKFALLQDVEEGRYYNILGEMLQVYDAPSGQVAVHFSDYTANSSFYNHVWGHGKGTTGRDGDPHGYTKSRPKSVGNWPGPFGKMSIQITLFDEQASFVREEVKVQDWVILKNVRIAFGKMGGCLEGYLHGDHGRVHIELLKRPDNNEIDPRWKAALARKLEYEKRFAKQCQEILDEGSGQKRKREDEPAKPNAKTRRKEKRAGAQSKVVAAEQKRKVKLDLNENIQCEIEAADQPIVPLMEVLKHRTMVVAKDSGREYLSPFDVRKCKANVRVVDFFPSKIEDFAVGRRTSEYDMLSDYSGGEDTDPEENMQAFRSGKGIPEKKWEWRFALQVVDASDKSFEQRTWLIVNNYDAQMLLNRDATNLRKDKEALREVKEKLCILWGDLEEQKPALTKAERPNTQTSSMDSKSSHPLSYQPGDQPPLDSDDEEENEDPGKTSNRSFQSITALSEQEPNAGTSDQGNALSEQKQTGQLQFSNKAFTCCIKQYGTKVKEDDAFLANTGDGRRWKRNFGLFGTMII